MDEILMSPDTCMQFLVWSYYYHNILPTKSISYADCRRFSPEDANRLDGIKDTLFKCFTEESVANACAQFRMAKLRNEPCPFPQSALDKLFASEI
ncbi:MAG: hypothetical protein Q4C30_09300 [Bacteroidia bacterium]|nr:hypothetical protein [Bacteroidia bacterium]